MMKLIRLAAFVVSRVTYDVRGIRITTFLYDKLHPDTSQRWVRPQQVFIFANQVSHITPAQINKSVSSLYRQ